MALQLLNFHWLSEFYYLKYLINKKELKKTKNTIKLSEFDLICGKNLVFGVRVPLRLILAYYSDLASTFALQEFRSGQSYLRTKLGCWLSKQVGMQGQTQNSC